MFSSIDADGGGDIDRVEFGAALARAGVAHAVSDKEAGLVFDALDADGSGAISYPEFAALFDAALLGRAMAATAGGEGGAGGVAVGGEVRVGREARGASTQHKHRKQNKTDNHNHNHNHNNNQADAADADDADAAAAAADADADAARYTPSAITPRSYYDLSRLKQRVAEKIVAKSAFSKTAYRSHTQELLNTFQQVHAYLLTNLLAIPPSCTYSRLTPSSFLLSLSLLPCRCDRCSWTRTWTVTSATRTSRPR